VSVRTQVALVRTDDSADISLEGGDVADSIEIDCETAFTPGVEEAQAVQQYMKPRNQTEGTPN
jgi:hypothetical protein